MKDQIIIIDWIGNLLFEGHYEDNQVDEVLNANRCHCLGEDCDDCNGTGYTSNFYVYWKDEQDERNVYEWINY